MTLLFDLMKRDRLHTHACEAKSMVNNIARCWLYDVVMSYVVFSSSHLYNKVGYKVGYMSITFVHLLSTPSFIFIVFT